MAEGDYGRLGSVCPPIRHQGGDFRLNCTNRRPLEVKAKRKAKSFKMEELSFL
jgi:hypothetical protein